MKEKFKYIIVVVLYKDLSDINELIQSAKKNLHNYKIILVSNHYNDDVDIAAEKIAKNNSCDFLKSENNGYGEGNNTGIQFALNKYEFDYLIVSNPDIVISKFDDSKLDLPSIPSIYAPEIIAKNGKRQNPHWVKYHKILEKWQYISHKQSNIFLDYLVIALTKFERILFNMIYKNKIKKIYAAHGSFIMFSQSVFENVLPIYDKKMFLFYEEMYVAHISAINNIETFYYPLIKVMHKEDGSMLSANVNQKNFVSNSVIYYYENVVSEGKNL